RDRAGQRNRPNDLDQSLAALAGEGRVGALRIASQIRHGVSGISSSRMPNGRSASITALTTAGVDRVVPPSPMPLTPLGLCEVGVSVRSVSNMGRSAAVGRR